MNTLLIELLTEELPANVILSVGDYLKEEVSKVLRPRKAHFYGTPRRLALICEDFEDESQRKEEVIIGPPKEVCFDKEEKPTQALLGFLSKNSASLEDVLEVENKGGTYIAIKKVSMTKKPTQILMESFEDILLNAPIPKSMRWTSSQRIRFSRPIRNICAIYNGEVFPLRFGDLTANARTLGHRFLSQGYIQIQSPKDYKEVLRKAYVLVDYEERLSLIKSQVEEKARECGGKPESPEGLYQEVANLVEFPFVVVGKLPERFLTLPERVIITVLAHHQRFFCVRGEKGLLPYFIAVSNNLPKDNRIVRGYEKVIKARLEDALFFYKEDLKTKLEDLVPRLSGVLFHPKAGSMLDKTNRLVLLVEKLVDQLGFDRETKEKAKRAAYLSKADLLTNMVREYDELQGYMGYVYSKLQGEDEEVAVSLLEQYMPRSTTDDLPKTKIGKILSLAEKLDNIHTLIGVGEIPKGSSDPYGLRRSAYGVLSILEESAWDVDISKLFESIPQDLIDFLKGRIRAYLETYPYDVVDAVLEVCSPQRPFRCISLVKRLAHLKEEEKFKGIVQGYKRVVKILPKGHESAEVREELMREEAELNLWKKVKALENCCTDIIDLYSLKESIDEFFDKVLVMDRDESVRNNRLSLLARIKKLFNQYADLSKIVYNE